MIHKKNLSKLPPDMRYNKFQKEEKAKNFKGARHSVFDRLRAHPHVIGVSITRIDQFGLIGVKHFLNFNFPLNVCWIFRFFANMNTLIQSCFLNIFYLKIFFYFLNLFLIIIYENNLKFKFKVKKIEYKNKPADKKNRKTCVRVRSRISFGTKFLESFVI